MQPVQHVEPTPEGETIHAVLATQARSRTSLELWSGTLIGAANAALIWFRFPSLHWLAAGFAATVGYCLWGLADRKLVDVMSEPASDRLSIMLMKGLRALAGASGWIAALFAIAAFLTAGLRKLGAPGS